MFYILLLFLFITPISIVAYTIFCIKKFESLFTDIIDNSNKNIIEDEKIFLYQLNNIPLKNLGKSYYYCIENNNLKIINLQNDRNLVIPLSDITLKSYKVIAGGRLIFYFEHLKVEFKVRLYNFKKLSKLKSQIL